MVKLFHHFLLRRFPLLGGIKKFAEALKSDVVALCVAMADPRTPLLPRLIIFFAVIYALSPIDLLPDFIPLLGLLDDLIILPFLLKLAIRQLPPEVLEEARQKSTGDNLHRLKVMGGGLVLGLWGALAMAAARMWR
jgi:uncharacterized membrane protein YkvA (DUF1232 family)